MAATRISYEVVGTTFVTDTNVSCDGTSVENNCGPRFFLAADSVILNLVIASVTGSIDSAGLGGGGVLVNIVAVTQGEINLGAGETAVTGNSNFVTGESWGYQTNQHKATSRRTHNEFLDVHVYHLLSGQKVDCNVEKEQA